MHEQRKMDQAAEDVRVIRGMMEKAENSLRESSNFFLWAGLIFLSGFIGSLLQNIAVMLVPFNGQNLALIAYVSNFLSILEIIAVIVVYLIYRSKARRMGEVTGRKLISLWSSLLVGGFFIGRLLPIAIRLMMGQMDGSAARLAALMPHFIRCLLIAVGLFISGILTDKFSWKIFSILVILLSLAALILFRFSIELPLNGNQATMTFTPAATVLTAMPAVTMLIIWAVVKRK